MSVAVGSRLGPFEILAPLGAGGMGDVYRARDTRLDRIVAIKLLPSDRRASHAGGMSFIVKWVGGRVRLDEGEHILGRDPDAEILLDSPGVSRRHARLTIMADRAMIEDLGSKNGTFVGDVRVEGSSALGDGDTIGVGSVRLTFSVLQLPGSTETEAR